MQLKQAPRKEETQNAWLKIFNKRLQPQRCDGVGFSNFYFCGFETTLLSY